MVMKAKNAFSSNFSKRLFLGTFGDNWTRHRDRFERNCKELLVDQSIYTDYIKENLKYQALNFVEVLTGSDPNISWNRLAALNTARYANKNHQKEVYDRLYRLLHAYFVTPGEDPGVTLERGTA